MLKVLLFIYKHFGRNAVCTPDELSLELLSLPNSPPFTYTDEQCTSLQQPTYWCKLAADMAGGC